MKHLFLSLILLLTTFSFINSQNSVAREWNEANLEAVRLDFAQPTLTARNLWHVSAAMYDAWAIYDLEAETYFLGKEVGGFYIPFNGIDIPTDPAELAEAREEAISYAAYRVLKHRYSEDYVPNAQNNEPDNPAHIAAIFDDLMTDLGYDMNFVSTDFSGGSAAALGNYIAEQIILFGLQDGSNELGFHQNQYYQPVNLGVLQAVNPGNPSLQDPNRWQRLLQFIGQGETDIDPNFLSPEWGNVVPAVLTEDDITLYERDENTYQVYCDPGAPPYIDEVTDETGLDDDYKKGFMMVAVWSSLLDHTDGNMIDISPNNIGNITSYPESFDEYDDFYDFFTGDDASQGYSMNPATGMPYDTQTVPMGDYGRVLAEFWADGPDSETPPGHWYTILNYVNDHPDLVKKWNGQGDLIEDLEWDIKTYFTLGANMHDCAIGAWGVKGWYDYIRPISAIRYMADQGQCSDLTLPNYDPSGLPLIDGFSELVDLTDPLIGVSQENLNKVKIKAWRGPAYLDQVDLATGELLEPIQDSVLAGAGWILAENWWPYQRPSFITPPFAGYVSGHSTFSRGAAVVLEQMTGDEYFPGGMGVFPCPQNDFLVFEEGPSVYLELQWAKYKDASDQCSLSRIFGGIHPPADDIPGRLIGQKIGEDVYEYTTSIMFNDEPRVLSNTINTELINDAYASQDLIISVTFNREMDEMLSPSIIFSEDISNSLTASGTPVWISSNTYQWTFTTADANVHFEDLGFEVTGAQDLEGLMQLPYAVSDRFTIDTENPSLIDVSNVQTINEASTGTLIELSFEFNERMTLDTLENIIALLTGLSDAAGNPMISEELITSIVVDTKAPEALSITPDGVYMNESSVVSGTYSLIVEYDDEMSLNVFPAQIFPNEDENPTSSMTFNPSLSNWISATQFEFVYDVIDEDLELSDIDFQIVGGVDDVGNLAPGLELENLFNIDTKAPSVVSAIGLDGELITDAETGNSLSYTVTFNEEISAIEPVLSFSETVNSLVDAGNIAGDGIYTWNYTVEDSDEEIENPIITISEASDLAGNVMQDFENESTLFIDNKNPCAFVTANVYDITTNNEGISGFQIITSFDDDLNQELMPSLNFPSEDPSSSISLNLDETGWFGSNYIFSYDVNSELTPLAFIDLEFENIEDENGNAICQSLYPDYFSIQLDTFLNVTELEQVNVLLYPNPVNRGEFITINSDQLNNPIYQIIDARGRLVDAEVNSQGRIDSSDLVAGDYYLRIIDIDRSYVLRLVVLD